MLVSPCLPKVHTMSDSASSNRARLWWIVPLILFALVVRGGVLAWRFDHLQQDPDAYRLLAENLANHGVFGQVDAQGHAVPTAFRPPGYPWLLSWLVVDGQLSSLSVAALHLAIGLATIGLVFLIGSQLGSPVAGIVAAILLAIDPILLGQSTLVMTESLATLLAAIVWWLVLRNQWTLQRENHLQSNIGWSLALGASLAAGFLCRPVFIVWAAWIVLMLLLSIRNRFGATLVTAATVTLVIAAAVGGWTWRNNSVMGRPIWATTHGGYTLLLGNNPSFYRYLAEGEVGEKWDAEFFHRRWAERFYSDPRLPSFWTAESIDTSKPATPLGEIEDDRLAYETAKASIRREPGMFVASCFVRLGRLWSPMPHAGDQSNRLRLAIGGFYLMLFVCCGLGIWRIGWRLLTPPWMAMLLLAVALSCVHSIYWSNMRMRSLATPLLAVVAAVGIVGRRVGEISDAAVPDKTSRTAD